MHIDMRATIKYIPLFISLLCCNISMAAYYPFVRNFKKAEYNAGSQTWCIQQHEGGSMWFANSGILTYDGSDWSLTKTGNHTSVRSLYFDRQEERMYFGAANEFGYLYINRENQLEYCNLSKETGTAIEDIWAIHKAGDNLWLRESTNMYLYDGQSLKQFSFKDKITTSACIGGILYISVNSEGIYRLDADGQFREIPSNEKFRNDKVVSLLEDSDGGIIIVCLRSGIYTYNGGKVRKSPLDVSREIVDASIYCAASNDRYLALGTVRNGVYIMQYDRGRTIHMNTYTGLQNNTVLSMEFDRNGDLWLGLDNGIDLVQISSPVNSLFGNSDIYGAGYSSETYNGKLWLGTNQGLYQMDLDEGTGSGHFLHDIKEIRGQVWSLMRYDGSLFCCHDSGLYIFKGGRVSHIPMNGTWKLEPLRHHPDYLLGSSYDRLFLIRKESGKWVFDSWVSGFEDASKAFEEDSDGSIWFSHWIKGLFRLTLDMETKSVTSVDFMSKYHGFPEDWSNIPIELNGEIIFTTVDGYYDYDRYSGRAYRMKNLNGIFKGNPENASAFRTATGDLYFSSSGMQALYYRTPDGKEIMDSLSLRGLVSKRIPGFEDIRNLSDDEIMVNTDDGFSVINTTMLRDASAKKAPSVYIKNIYSRISGKEACIRTSLGESRDSLEVLRLMPNENSLIFKVAYPVYEDNRNVQYSYMLSDYDSKWSEYSSSNQKEYTRLPHGRYRFSVRARSDLYPDVKETFIDLEIKAPWYLTDIALFIYIVAGILFMWLTYRALERYSTKRARLIALKKENELRRKQMQKDLEHKAQDLAASTMNVIRKNEILLDIDESLAKVSEYIAEDRNKSLKLLGRIRRDIRENIQHDDVWQKFEENFDIVYDDFLKRLSERYPKLTMSDKKLCAYLKMNLSSKDIAPLLNMTVRSVEMTRYRLRKKLELSHDDNLTSFLGRF